MYYSFLTQEKLDLPASKKKDRFKMKTVFFEIFGFVYLTIILRVA